MEINAPDVGEKTRAVFMRLSNGGVPDTNGKIVSLAEVSARLGRFNQNNIGINSIPTDELRRAVIEDEIKDTLEQKFSASTAYIRGTEVGYSGTTNTFKYNEETGEVGDFEGRNTSWWQNLTPRQRRENKVKNDGIKEVELTLDADKQVIGVKFIDDTIPYKKTEEGLYAGQIKLMATVYEHNRRLRTNNQEIKIAEPRPELKIDMEPKGQITGFDEFLEVSNSRK